MKIDDVLNEVVIEMMMNALIDQFKKNKEQFIEGVMETKEFVLVAPAGNPLMNKETIKMNIKFSLDEHNILDYLKED